MGRLKSIAEIGSSGLLFGVNLAVNLDKARTFFDHAFSQDNLRMSLREMLLGSVAYQPSHIPTLADIPSITSELADKAGYEFVKMIETAPSLGISMIGLLASATFLYMVLRYNGLHLPSRQNRPVGQS